MSRDPAFINFGSNSGYQAVNLAYLWGARRIVLVGFDMRGDHFFGKHPPGLDRTNHYGEWIKKFGVMARDLQADGVEVINCSMRSALECFPKRPLVEVLCALSSR